MRDHALLAHSIADLRLEIWFKCKFIALNEWQMKIIAIFLLIGTPFLVIDSVSKKVL